MKVTKYDSNLLIDFYKENEIEFSEDNGYCGEDIKSYALLEDDKIIGAISFSVYRGVNYIEVLAVDKEYRKKGYGTMLLDKVINELERPIYIISKNNNYFLNYGFTYDDKDLINDECKACSLHGVTCFPKVMVFKKEGK